MVNSDTDPPFVPLPDAVVDPDARDAPSLFARIGGRPVVEAFIDRLYAAIETDPDLRPLFPDDLSPGRLHQQWFFEEWLGGERGYTARRGSPRLGQRHLAFAITDHAATLWLGHMRQALVGAGLDAAHVAEIMRGLAPLATHFVRAAVPQSDTQAP